MSVTENTSMVLVSQGRVLEQYKELPNIEGLIQAYVTPTQTLVASLWDMYEMTMDAAVGDQLDDIYGNIVGITRDGDTDADFLIRIKAQIKINRSSGTIGDLLGVARLLVPVAATLRLVNHYPACFELWAEGVAVTDGDKIADRMNETKAAGVRGIFIYYPQSYDETFRFENWVASSYSTTLELSDVVYFSGQYYVCGYSTAPLTIVSPDLVNWSPVNIGTPGNVDWYALATNGSRIVVGGSQAIGITWQSAYSDDGNTWTNVSVGDPIWDLLWDGTQFVAACLNGGIETSPTGSSWTSQVSGTIQDFYAIAWDGTILVAVGFGGQVYTSPDGAVWTVRVSGTVNDLYAVAHNGTNLFAAVGATGTIITSPDGIVWTTRTASTANDLRGVAFGDGAWYAVDTSQPHTSPDGINWRPATNTTGTPRNVRYVNGRFVLTGDNGLVHYHDSTTGNAWDVGKWATGDEGA